MEEKNDELKKEDFEINNIDDGDLKNSHEEFNDEHDKDENKHGRHHKKNSKIKQFVEKINNLNEDDSKKEALRLYEENLELHKEVERLKKTVEEKEKESIDYLDRYRRSLAEVENIRKRTTNEKQEAIKYANTNLIKDLIEIPDNFDMAISHSDNPNLDVKNFITGILMIEKQFSELLFKKYGVEKIGEENDEFDPNKHQAMMMEEGDFNKAIVLEVFRKGYILHDRVLRSAQVKVGLPKANDSTVDTNNEDTL